MQKMKNYFRKSIVGLLMAICVLFLVLFVATKERALELATFFIALITFIAAALAICQQHKAGIKQEIVGAWQILANKAAGNSGKIEAIEFLAKQKKSLQGINMSSTSNGGKVYLRGLDVSEKTLGHQADLVFAKFEGADLWEAHFEGADLREANFEGAYLWRAHFEKAVLHDANFKGADLWEAHFESNVPVANFEGASLRKAHFEGAFLLLNNLTRADFGGAKGMDPLERFAGNYVWCDADKPKMGALPITANSDSFAFEFECDTAIESEPEPELDKDKKPTGRTKHFIKLVFKTPSNPN